MEKNNLNTAPTEQELYNAGFKEDIFGCLSIRLSKYLKIVVDLDNNVCRVIGEEVAEKLLLTKQKINDAFALFNQPLPKWEKPKPHQYSYKGLKAEGKIPHDRSGEDHDSIEAFKKLLAICEALNGMFKPSPLGDIYAPYYDNGLDWEIHLQNYQSPIYFTSKEAKDAFRSAPENVELFKTFLKIK